MPNPQEEQHKQQICSSKGSSSYKIGPMQPALLRHHFLLAISVSGRGSHVVLSVLATRF